MGCSPIDTSSRDVWGDGAVAGLIVAGFALAWASVLLLRSRWRKPASIAATQGGLVISLPLVLYGAITAFAIGITISFVLAWRYCIVDFEQTPIVTLSRTFAADPSRYHFGIWGTVGTHLAFVGVLALWNKARGESPVRAGLGLAVWIVAFVGSLVLIAVPASGGMMRSVHLIGAGLLFVAFPVSALLFAGSFSDVGESVPLTSAGLLMASSGLAIFSPWPDGVAIGEYVFVVSAAWYALLAADILRRARITIR